MDGVAEIAVQGVYVAPVPGHFDGVADGPLHPAGGGVVPLGDVRVQALGHGVDILGVLHGHQDGLPQVLVALDVGRHADLVQDLGDGHLVAVGGGKGVLARRAGRGFQHTADQHALLKGLDKIIGETGVQQFLDHFLALECAGDKKGGVQLAGGVVALLDGQRVQPRHKGIQQNHVGPDRQHLLQHFGAVLFHHGHVHTLLLQRFTAARRDIRPGVRHQKSNFIHLRSSHVSCVAACGCTPRLDRALLSDAPAFLFYPMHPVLTR